MKYKVLCTAPFKRFPEVVDLFYEIFDGEIIEYLPHSELVNKVYNFDGLIPNARIKIDKEVINSGSSLSAIYQPSMGYEHIDTNYLEEKKIQFNALGLDSTFKATLWSTAEHTISLILSLLKNHVESVTDVKTKGLWDNRSYSIEDLNNIKVGVIGLGNIGKKVSYICNAFGAEIVAYDPYVKKQNFLLTLKNKV